MQETCSNTGFQYRGGSSFLSVKPDGRQYSCRCSQIDCPQINCQRISVGLLLPRSSNPTATDEDPDHSRTENEIPNVNPTILLAPIVSPSPRPTPSRPIYQPAIFVPATSPEGKENTIQSNNTVLQKILHDLYLLYRLN